MQLQEFDNRCIEILNAISKKRSKYCFRSAINHLERAEILFPIDITMAVFRCYTAEEEAATGLMQCLKDKGYQNSDKLLLTNHQHKNAVIQFFSILSQFIEDHFREFGIDLFLVIVENNNYKSLIFEVNIDLGNGLETFRPIPPFNFALKYETKRFSYKKQIAKLMASRQVTDISKYIKTLANQRNLLLYANEKGFPSEVTIEDKFFPAMQRRVFALLRAYLMIEPYKEKQPFVQDILDAFLLMLEKQDFDDMHDNL